MSYAKTVVESLLAAGLTLATAESCTGGLVSEIITRVPGCSASFVGGVCAYANEVKEKLLGVRHETLARYGAVSAQTAQEMADGVRARTGADIGISTTGIAGPGGGTPEKPVGLVYIAVSGEALHCAEALRLDPMQLRTRQEIREDAAERALTLVLRAIAKTAEIRGSIESDQFF